MTEHSGFDHCLHLVVYFQTCGLSSRVLQLVFATRDSRNVLTIFLSFICNIDFTAITDTPCSPFAMDSSEVTVFSAWVRSNVLESTLNYFVSSVLLQRLSRTLGRALIPNFEVPCLTKKKRRYVPVIRGIPFRTITVVKNEACGLLFLSCRTSSCG